jgi:putative transposase
LREVLNRIFCLLPTGGQQRLLSNDFPPGSTVHAWYRRWRRDGIGKKIHDADHPPVPRSSAVDSQSVMTGGQPGERGFDNSNKVHGRKRHRSVDRMALLLTVLVTAADVPDVEAACALSHQRLWSDLPRLTVVYSDNPYRAGHL